MKRPKDWPSFPLLVKREVDIEEGAIALADLDSQGAAGITIIKV